MKELRYSKLSYRRTTLQGSHFPVAELTQKATVSDQDKDRHVNRWNRVKPKDPRDFCPVCQEDLVGRFP